MVTAMETVQKNQLMELGQAAELIEQGHTLVISGEEALLAQLPNGKWIGGTIPYFYFKDQPGRMDKSHVFVTDFSDLAEDLKIATYSVETLKNITSNGFDNGFHFLILPALRDIHLSFALNAPNYEKLFENPLIGLIAGVDLDEFTDGRLSKTFDGSTGEAHTDLGVALHVKLPESQAARLEIINVFEGSDAFTLEVEEDGFVFEECIINGKKQNLLDFIQTNNIDISYPLVSDYGGANVNISFQRLDEENKQVVFYAPLFKDRTYRIAKSFDSYVDTFKAKAQVQLQKENRIDYNCNCILNYVYGGLDKASIGFSGATTFGEIAYQMLNQTFTYLTIDEQ